MFRPAKMKKLKVITLKKYQKSLLDTLHKTGLVQFADPPKDIQTRQDYFDLKKTTSIIIRIDRIVENFNSMAPAPQSKMAMIKEMISPKEIQKKEIKENLDDLLVKLQKMLDEINPEGLFTELTEIREKKQEDKNQLSYLKYLKFLDVNLEDVFENKYTESIFGFIDYNSQNILEKNLDCYIYSKNYPKEKKTLISLICLKDDLKKVNKNLQKLNFTPLEINPKFEGRPKSIISDLEEKISQLEKREKENVDKIRKLKKEYEDDLLAYKEKLEIAKDKYSAINGFQRSETSFVFSCWTKQTNLNKVKSIIKKNSKDHYYFEISDPNKDDQVPTSLENPKILRPFESLTNMFGPPKYSEFDPTAIVAPIFILFFAFMLSDAIYGSLLLIFSYVTLTGAGKYSKGLKDLASVLAWCAGATIIVGIVVNSYLGNFLEYINFNIPHILNGIDDAIILLILSLFMGIVHLYIGLVLGSIQLIREGNIKDAILTKIIWFPLSISAFIMITDITGIYSYIILEVPKLSNNGNMINLGVLFTCAVAILINQGPLGFFEFTGFLGDWLSYARILALGLATSGLALTINLLADIFWGTAFVFGFIIAAIIFIAGHIMNCTLQVLGAYIHTLRLQYVEFFSKFYEGRGKLFKPYIEQKFYTK